MPTSRPRIMGVLNVTPDSFSDGGRFYESDVAAAHALRMVREGADIVDVGGESTRPGSDRTSEAEQKRRVVTVIRRVREALDRDADQAAVEERLARGRGGEGGEESGGGPTAPLISIDTTRSGVAAAALEAGAAMLNDVSAGREDAGMFTLAAERDVPIVLMHMLGQPATMQKHPTYHDVVAEVRDFLLERAAAAEAAGVPRERIILDPGIGFGKTVRHNLELLAALPRFVAAGYPILLGASRKRFIHSVAGENSGDPDRLGGTVAATALAVAAGVALIRVHDVAANRQAADVAAAVREQSLQARLKHR